jgi:hypothetical protein
MLMSENHNSTSSPVVKLHAESPSPAMCVVAELDRQAQAAMEAFNAAEEQLLAEPRPDGAPAAAWKWSATRPVIDGTACAMRRRTLPPGAGADWRRLLELDMAVDALAADPAIKTIDLDYEADKAARLVALIRECVEAIIPDDAR